MSTNSCWLQSPDDLLAIVLRFPSVNKSDAVSDCLSCVLVFYCNKIKGSESPPVTFLGSERRYFLRPFAVRYMMTVVVISLRRALASSQCAELWLACTS